MSPGKGGQFVKKRLVSSGGRKEMNEVAPCSKANLDRFALSVIGV